MKWLYIKNPKGIFKKGVCAGIMGICFGNKAKTREK
jgi:hypothetical protein